MNPTPPTPLAVMLAVMQRKWQEGDYDAAATLARAAAPYLHARRASARDAAPEPQHWSDAQLQLLLGDDDGEAG
ncbi:MAG TPA: hypothetical protein VME92_20575 [Acetobacteraceae bacterium]|nr:hypothetical protein [Acetobacteraceae bacterium]